MTSKYPPFEELVPHGPPMRALDALVDWAPGQAECEVRIRPSSPFVKERRLASVVCLEYMAQAVAACLGYEAFTHGQGVRVGMIVGVREMELIQPSVEVGALLRIRVERLRGSDEASTFRGETSVGDGQIARALMTLVHSDRPPS